LFGGGAGAQRRIHPGRVQCQAQAALFELGGAGDSRFLTRFGDGDSLGVTLGAKKCRDSGIGIAGTST
jgi:hypothetical protein